MSAYDNNKRFASTSLNRCVQCTLAAANDSEYGCHPIGFGLYECFWSKLFSHKKSPLVIALFLWFRQAEYLTLYIRWMLESIQRQVSIHRTELQLHLLPIFRFECIDKLKIQTSVCQTDTRVSCHSNVLSIEENRKITSLITWTIPSIVQYRITFPIELISGGKLYSMTGLSQASMESNRIRKNRNDLLQLAEQPIASH